MRRGALRRPAYIFDCGTGFRSLGQQLGGEANGKRHTDVRAHLRLSLPLGSHPGHSLLPPALRERRANQFVFHSSRRTRSLKRVMEEQMASPYFPVNTSEMKAQRRILRHGRRLAPTWRSRHHARHVAEPSAGLHGLPAGDERGRAGLRHRQRARRRCSTRMSASWPKGADVLIYDAQYLPEEYEARRRGLGTQPLARSGQHRDAERRQGTGACSIMIRTTTTR